MIGKRTCNGLWLALGVWPLAMGCDSVSDQMDYCAEVDTMAAQCLLPPPVEADGLIYEIYLRSFYDTDGDGIGDLEGVVQKLDHLEMLGVGTIWLTPIFDSPSVAGYDPSDLGSIDADYGEIEDLERLATACEERGIRLMVDIPINHTSREHPWFQVAESQKASIYRDFYIFGDSQFDEYRWFESSAGDWYYAYFGEALPDLDWFSPSLAGQMRSLMEGWVDHGLGGYRLDAVAQLIEEDGDIAYTESGHCLSGWMYGHMKGVDPNFVMLSEAWHDDPEIQLTYLGTESKPETDWLLDMPRQMRFRDSFQMGELREDLPFLLLAHDKSGISGRMAPYLGNHDLRRFATRIEDERIRRAWMVNHLLLPGAPVLYYGEEIDLEDSTENMGQDFGHRGPMQWNSGLNAGFTEGVPWYSIDTSYLDGVNVADQLEDPDSMLSLVVALADLRRQSRALESHGLTFRKVVSNKGWVVERDSDDDRVILVQNFSPDRLHLELEANLGPGMIELTAESMPHEGLVITLEPYEYRVFGTVSLADFVIPSQVVY